jgi:uncharacterized protein
MLSPENVIHVWEGEGMIQVKVAGVSLSNMGYVVLLRHEQDKRVLPIFVGAAEAQAIALRLDKVEVPRPLTHDLFKNVLDCLECRLKRVVVSALADSTFYGLLVIEWDGGETEVDARPSDAIALALRFAAPIFVVQKVMDQAGVVLGEEDSKTSAKPPARADKPAPPAPSELEALKQQLEQAIQKERYEDAARLRDEIKRVGQSHDKN